MLDEVNNTVAVAEFIVVPGHKFNKCSAQLHAGLGVVDGGVGVADEVGGDDLVLSVAKVTLHGALRGSLHSSVDLVHGSRFIQGTGQIDNGDIRSGDAERHTGQLAVESRDDLADGFGGTGGSGDDVLSRSTTITPCLSRWTIDSFLGSSVGVDGGHQTLLDSKVVVDHLGKGSQAVGGAGSIADDVHVWLVLFMVDTHNKHGCIGAGG